uniref:Uncharacterized protein n=1 Tax=Triticum urartu TaxID=4572 RepID=A0A8R7V5U7_TRIUA
MWLFTHLILQQQSPCGLVLIYDWVFLFSYLYTIISDVPISVFAVRSSVCPCYLRWNFRCLMKMKKRKANRAMMARCRHVTRLK